MNDIRCITWGRSIKGAKPTTSASGKAVAKVFHARPSPVR